MQDYKLNDTPVARSESLRKRMCRKTLKENGQIEKVPYSVRGSLMYATMCTRLDIL